MEMHATDKYPYGGLKELTKIAWPLIISTGTFTLLHYFDRMFLSWYSEATFRAALPAGILFFTLVCGFMALAGFTNTFVAQYWGAGDRAGCAKATAQGIFFALISFPLVLALLPVGLLILHLSGHPPEVLALEKQYLTALMPASLGMIMSSAMGSFFSGRGKTRVIMSCNILANAVNIVLDYALIFGKWGFPELGIQGAAIATCIGSFIAPLIMGFMIYCGANNRLFESRAHFRFHKPLFLRMIRFGIPAGLHWFLDVSAFTLFVLFIGRMGAEAHVASNIALSVNLIAFMPMVGMGMAASILVGQYLGRNQPHFAEKIGWLAMRIGVAYTLLMGITFICFPEFYIRGFMQSGEAPSASLLQTTKWLLYMMTLWGLFDAAAIILSGALKGAGDTHFVMWFQTAAAWGLLVGGQVVILFVLRRGLFVSWSWTIIYIMVLALGYGLRFRSERWKKIDLLERRIDVVTAPLPEA
jgi:multidrug resistance protein, MATE family